MRCEQMKTEIELSGLQIAQLRQMMGHPAQFHWADYRYYDGADWTPTRSEGESMSSFTVTELFGYQRIFGHQAEARAYLSHLVGKHHRFNGDSVLQVYNFSNHGDEGFIMGLRKVSCNGVEVMLGNGELTGQEIFSGIAAYVHDKRTDVDPQELRQSLGEGLIHATDTLTTPFEALERRKLEYVRKCLLRIA